MESSGQYLRITEQSNALDYLLRAVEFLEVVNKDPFAWKWVVLSLHGALYGFAICACKGTDPDVVKWKNKKGVYSLVGFNRILCRCQTKNGMYPWGHCKPLVLNDSQKNSLRILKTVLRDNFEHYSPMAWSIELHGLPQISLDVLEIIRFLVQDSKSWVGLERDQKQTFIIMLKRAIEILHHNSLYLELKTLESSTTVRPPKKNV